MDKLTPERRSENMRQIRSKNTAPELFVRKLCREAGFPGYRIRRKELPGKPDLAWIGRRLAIFVHGCFWHGHDCAEGSRKPKTNRVYWLPKIRSSKQRDSDNMAALRKAGWKMLVIWECETRKEMRLTRKLQKFLSATSGKPLRR